MRHFQDQVIHMELVQEVDERPPLAALDGLASVVAETQVHGALAIERVEHAVDRCGRERRVVRIAGYISFVHLQALAGQSGHLLRQHVCHRHHQRVETAIMPVEQCARQHIGAGHGELERTARHRRREFAIGQQVERPFTQRPFDNPRGFAPELHRAFTRELLVVAAADLGAHPRHGAHEVIDHAVGVGMIDIEAVEFAIRGQVDSGLPLNVEDDARGVEARLLAWQGGQPVGNRVTTDSGGEDRGIRRQRVSGTGA